MSEFKAGDVVEFVEHYVDYAPGDRVTVTSVTHWDGDTDILKLAGYNNTVFSHRVKRAEIRVGDTVRVNPNVSSPKWIGAEGVVTEILTHENRVKLRLTKIYSESIYNAGEIAVLMPKDLDVVKGSEPEGETTTPVVYDAAPKVGDKVRITDGAWEGSEGVVEFFDDGVAGVRMTAPSKDCWISKGQIGRVSSSVVKIAEPEAEPQARVVKRSEVKVGDLVRVTYSLATTGGVVKEALTRVREGVVTKVSGPELHSGTALINAYFDGLSDAVYEVLPAPEPVKEPLWTEKRAVGSVGLQKNGRRILTKTGLDSWKITYPDSKMETVKSNESMSYMFEEDGFLWADRK